MTLLVKGDFGKIADWQKRFSNTPKLIRTVNKHMAEEAVNLVKEGFDKGKDPYGRSWNAPNNLQITGRMRSYAVTRVDLHGFQVSSTDKKAIWHHAPRKRKPWGGKALPTRLQVPVGGRLPKSWSKRMSEAAQDVMDQILG